MSFEQFVRQGQEAELNKTIKDRGVGLGEIIKDEQLSRYLEMVADNSATRDVRNDILEKYAKSGEAGLSDAEKREMGHMVKKVAEIKKEVGEIFEFMKGEKIFKRLLFTHPYFDELRTLTSLNSGEKLLDENLFALIYLKKPTDFLVLKNMVDSYKNVIERMKKRGEELDKAVDKLGLSRYAVQAALEMTDPVERDREVQKMIKEKISAIRMFKRNEATREINQFFVDAQRYMQDLNNNVGNIGRRLGNVFHFSTDPTFRTYIEEKRASLNEGRENKPGMTIGEVFEGRKNLEAKIDNDKTAEQVEKDLKAEWNKFKIDEARSRSHNLGMAPEQALSYWETNVIDLTPTMEEDLKTAFLNKYKAKFNEDYGKEAKESADKKEGSWSEWFRGMINSILGDKYISQVASKRGVLN
jgi:hypothetical protein